MVWIRRSLILIHRYLGTVLSLLFLVWFVSGIGMIYARGMPSLTPQMRLQRLPALDLRAVQISPEEALQLAELDGAPARIRLVTLGERPVYRIGGVTIFADNGDYLLGIGPPEAITIASRFLGVPEEQMTHEWLEEIDQWTIGNAGQLPLHKITVDDADRTQLYIAQSSGDVTLMTTRGSRALAYVAAIPHWYYFKELRSNGPLWQRVIFWTSMLGCVLAIIGLTLAVMQFKFMRPFRFSQLSSGIPYSGAMRWHYITGAVFGIFTLTWVFSGLLSIEPYEWATGPGLDAGELQQTLVGGSLDLSAFPPLAGEWAPILEGKVLKELEYAWIQGQPYYIAHTVPADGSALPDGWARQEYSAGRAGGDANRLLVAANPLRVQSESFSPEMLMDQIRGSFGNTPIVEMSVLTQYDSYYYSRDFAAPLPAIRVKFDDPMKTWYYVDPAMSRIVFGAHRLDRVERWIYNGFHSLDFAFWYYNAALWQFGVIALCLGGAATSGIGVFLGFRRVFRTLKRWSVRIVGRRQPVATVQEEQPR